MSKSVNLDQLLKERLDYLVKNMKVVQNKLHDISADADTLKNRISGELYEDLNEKDNQIGKLITKLNEGNGDMNALIEQAREMLREEWKYEIKRVEWAESFLYSYELRVSLVEVEREVDPGNVDSIVRQLEEYRNELRRSMQNAEDRIMEICQDRQEEAYKIDRRIRKELNYLYFNETNRVMILSESLLEGLMAGVHEEEKAKRNAKAELAKNIKFSLVEGDLVSNYYLKVEKEPRLYVIDFEERKPANLIPSFNKKGELTVPFTFFNEEEVKVFRDVDWVFNAVVELRENGHEEENASKTLSCEFTIGSAEPLCFKDAFTMGTPYSLKMRIVHKEVSTQWSDEVEFTTPDFKDLCMWKECPSGVDVIRKYSVDEKNPRVATNAGGGCCTIVGNTPLPLNKVTSWSIKVLESEESDENGVCIGVAPFDIDQNGDDNSGSCGWYFDCHGSTLCSGPPHKFFKREHGEKEGLRQSVHTGDSVDVVMNTTKGELLFALNGVNLGVAYEGIPLDKPLVPCVLLYEAGDSVELVFN